MKLILSLVVLVLSSAAAGAAPIEAVASFSILGDMVQVVGGDRVHVTTIVGPNADTHVYEPKPSDAAAVAKAQIFFVNGLGFAGWMDRFVQSTGYKGPLIVASDGVKSHTMVDDGATVTDPHAWQSLSNGILYVENISKGLCSIDADGCALLFPTGDDFIEGKAAAQEAGLHFHQDVGMNRNGGRRAVEVISQQADIFARISFADSLCGLVSQ